MPQNVRSQGDLTCKILELFRTSMLPGCKKKRTENREQCYTHRSINMPEVRGGFFVMEVVIASTIEHPPKGLSEIFSLSFFSCSVFLLLLTRHP